MYRQAETTCHWLLELQTDLMALPPVTKKMPQRFYEAESRCLGLFASGGAQELLWKALGAPRLFGAQSAGGGREIPAATAQRRAYHRCEESFRRLPVR